MATCWSCGKDKLEKNDNLCRGCHHIVCVSCVAKYEHFGVNGWHGRSPTKRALLRESREAAQPSAHPTVLNVREIETICPNCNLVFDVPVPESHSG